MSIIEPEFISDEAYHYVNNWNYYIENILGLMLDEEERKIVDAVQRYKKVVVKSGHGRGKDFTAAAIAVTFFELHEPCKVIMTAPCYDNKTEILTDNGWKLFKDLSKNDLVAQRLNDNSIDFVKPLDYIEKYYDGELIGCKSQLIDFLVTPNHRCLFDANKSMTLSTAKKIKKHYNTALSKNKNWTQQKTASELGTSQANVSWAIKIADANLKYNGKIYKAKEIFGKTGRFCRIAQYKNGGQGDVDYFEFLGFWFAEGSAQFSPSKRKYRITLTQNDDIYVDGLLERVKKHFKNEWHKYKRSLNGYNWELYQKDIAEEFIKYGKAKTKKIPRYIKDSGINELRAFIKGFLIGDGSIDKNGSIKLCTSSKYLANDLHEMCIKAGYIANLRVYKRQSKKILHDKQGNITGTVYFGEKNVKYYEIRIWDKRGYYPQVTKKNWYIKKYKGFVYSVQVPTGIVMIRRNGKNHWSGNTGRQVKDIMIAEVSNIFKNSRIPLDGRLLTNGIWTDNQTWFLEGFKAGDKRTEDWTGYHSPNLMVIVTEGSGISDETYEAIEGLLTGENSRLLVCGNPNRNSGAFYNMFRGGEFYKMNLSCLDSPNVKYKMNLISGQVGYEWVLDRIRNWCQEISKNEFGENSHDFKFKVPDENGNYVEKLYRPNNLFIVKVLGDFADELDSNSLVSLSWIKEAEIREAEQNDNRLIVGIDVAGMGRDRTVFVFRSGNVIEDIKVYYNKDIMKTAGQIKRIIDGNKNRNIIVNIDTIGEGAGIYPRLAEQGYENYVISAKFSHSAKGLRDFTGEYEFVNMRAYCYWAVRDHLNPQHGINLVLPENDDLREELTETKYELRSDGKIIIEDKEKIKKRLKRSPDVADALALSFYPSEIMNFSSLWSTQSK